MFRRTLPAVLLLAASLTCLGGTTVASATVLAKPVTFTGKISCKVAPTSTITVKPGLTESDRKVTFTITATTAGCTGHTRQGGSKIVSGKISGHVTGTFSCIGLFFEGPPAMPATVIWKATGKAAAPTEVALTDGQLNESGTQVRYSAKQTGSFKGSGSAEVNPKQTESELEAECTTTTGLTTINVSSGVFT